MSASVEDVLATLRAKPEQRTAVAALAERLYGHVFRAVDGVLLYAIEQILWSEIDRTGVHDEEGALATALIAEALARVGHDPERSHGSIPRDITPAERIAAAYDDDCLLCRYEINEAIARESGQRCCDLEAATPDEEWEELQAQAAAGWRARNADALRRFGLL